MGWLRNALIFIAVVVCAATARAASPCDTVSEHRKDTVVVFSPPSTFTICYEGTEETDVVTGRRVYLQLEAPPGSAMFRFRVHGQEVEPKLTGLSVIKEETLKLATALTELSHSAQHISSMTHYGDGTPLGTARARYVGVVTSDFADALSRSRASVNDLPESARIFHRWCDELHASDFPGASDLRDACKSADPVETISQEVSDFESHGAAFSTARDAAREALVTAMAKPDDAAAAAEAVKALDTARAAADAIVASSIKLKRMARHLARHIATLRVAISSMNALRPNVPVFLASYGDAGNAVLRIDATPAGIDEGTRNLDDNDVSFRFQVVSRHYFDIEVGVGVTEGLPQLVSINSSSQIEGRDVDQFVALALVELEPARFIWADKPLAGLIRLPVIGIPLSRDPTQNFFVGAGIGWTGVGSITAGPYLLREQTLRSGFSIGQTVPAGTSLNAIASPQVNVGWFVSASIDLVGLFRLFVPEHLSSFDAATARPN